MRDGMSKQGWILRSIQSSGVWSPPRCSKQAGARVHFLDLRDAFLGPDGKPREDLYGPDRIHPNHEGYLVRVRLMRPLLGPPDGKAGGR
jgi:hypothetical protein